MEGSDHGNPIGTISVAESEGREPYPNRLSNCLVVAPPLGRRAAERLEHLLEKREFILEPISCNLAVMVPEDGFMNRAQQLRRRYGTLLIADEVACGFGRTGKVFACEHFDLPPGILCMGKEITGGAAPMGATIVTQKVAKSVEDKVGFWSTYGWHPSPVDVRPPGAGGAAPARGRRGKALAAHVAGSHGHDAFFTPRTRSTE